MISVRNSFDPAKLGDQAPATDLLLGRLADTVVDFRNHDHPAEGAGPDLYCLNLTSFMGDRMAAVLRRVADEQSEVFKERQRATALAEEFEREVGRLMAQVNRVVTVVNTWQRWREQADDGAPFAELYDQVLAALDGQDAISTRPYPTSTAEEATR